MRLWLYLSRCNCTGVETITSMYGTVMSVMMLLEQRRRGIVRDDDIIVVILVFEQE